MLTNRTLDSRIVTRSLTGLERRPDGSFMNTTDNLSCLHADAWEYGHRPVLHDQRIVGKKIFYSTRDKDMTLEDLEDMTPQYNERQELTLWSLDTP